MKYNIDTFTSKLLKQRIVLIAGEIDYDTLFNVSKSLMILKTRGSPDIEVCISNCNGGHIHTSLAIYDILRRYRGQKTGVVEGFARSMGAVLLQACEKRVCLEHAYLRIHNILWDSVSYDLIEDTKRTDQLRAEMRCDQELVNSILRKRTGKSEKEIYYACKQDRDMNANEALEFGLIDGIEKN